MRRGAKSGATKLAKRILEAVPVVQAPVDGEAERLMEEILFFVPAWLRLYQSRSLSVPKMWREVLPEEVGCTSPLQEMRA